MDEIKEGDQEEKRGKSKLNIRREKTCDGESLEQEINDYKLEKI